MAENNEPAPAPILLVRTEDLWWQATESDPIVDLGLSMRARRALHLADVFRAGEVRDLDMCRFVTRRGVGRGTFDEIAMLHQILRYRARVPAADRAAFEAALPRNRFPVSWLTALKDDRVEALALSTRGRGAVAAAGAGTVGDLLDLTLVDLRAQNGVGSSTEAELGRRRDGRTSARRPRFRGQPRSQPSPGAGCGPRRNRRRSLERAAGGAFSGGSAVRGGVCEAYPVAESDRFAAEPPPPREPV